MQPNGRVASVGEGRLGAVEVMPTAVAVRAKRCEDNNPKREICKSGVLHEAGAVCCEGVLQATHRLEKLLK